jgi:porin
MNGWCRRPVAVLTLGLALALLAVSSACAQPVEIPSTWGGDFLSRPRLTGDWFGFRDEMGKKGIVVDVDMLLLPQGVVSGGQDESGQFWGNAEYTLNVDTGKAGLWPGGFFRVMAMSGFGETVNKDSGAIWPVNTAALVPNLGKEGTTLVNLSFMQFLSPKFGVVAGKLYTLGGDANAFAHDYHTQFLYTGLNFNPVLALFPISAYGGGLVFLPFEGSTFTLSVLDPRGTTANNDITEAFDDGILLNAEGRVTIKPFGLVGHQLVGFGWSNAERVSLRQDPANTGRALLFYRFPRLQDPGPVLRAILERFAPGLLGPVQPLNEEKDTWSVYYNFDQYLWNPDGDKTRGIGMFFRFGASDGNPNPIKYGYNVGVSGNGIIPGRLRDSFGIGWARTVFSDKFLPVVRDRIAGVGLNKEDAVEMYYNFEITRAVSATLDLQIIDPAIGKQLDRTAQRLEDVNTAVVAGLRLYMRF